jgi:hypothetical protein
MKLQSANRLTLLLFGHQLLVEKGSLDKFTRDAVVSPNVGTPSNLEHNKISQKLG